MFSKPLQQILALVFAGLFIACGKSPDSRVLPSTEDNSSSSTQSSGSGTSSGGWKVLATSTAANKFNQVTSNQFDRIKCDYKMHLKSDSNDFVVQTTRVTLSEDAATGSEIMFFFEDGVYSLSVELASVAAKSVAQFYSATDVTTAFRATSPSNLLADNGSLTLYVRCQN